MNTLTIAVLSILLSVAAQFSLKAGMSSAEVKEVLEEPLALRTLISVLTNKFIFGGFLLYGMGAVVWLAVLAKWDVSKAYPLVGLGFVFTVAIGFVLGEQVTMMRTIGVLFICCGVFLVGAVEAVEFHVGSHCLKAVGIGMATPFAIAEKSCVPR